MSELRILEDDALACTACRLAETRTHVVFGVGAPDADLLFVGEAPGRNEDLQGEPFVGAAGQLLNQLLAGIGMAREDVYIANVLKCRPPGNRDPRDDEIESCKGFLRHQLELIDPRVVATLGNFATKLLLKTDTGITRLRGRPYRWWRDKTLVPTYHPAAALRGGERVMAAMRQDFEVIRSALEAPAQSAAEALVRDPEQLDLFS